MNVTAHRSIAPVDPKPAEPNVLEALIASRAPRKPW